MSSEGEGPVRPPDLICPSCHATIPDLRPEVAPFCARCGWEAPPTPRWLRRVLLRPKRLIAIGLPLVVAAAFFTQQYASWGKFAFESFLLRVKTTFRVASLDDLAQLGRICNALKKHDCSIDAYGTIVAQRPTDTTALANLAMAQTKAQRYAEALPNYESFFKLGGSALDVLYWNGRTLKELGRTKEAISAYYRTIQADPTLLDVTEEIVELLAQSNRHDEALGVIGSFIHRLPSYRSYWSATIVTINAALEQKVGTSRAVQMLKIPAIGEHHFLPIKFSTENPYGFALVDTGATYLTMGATVVRDTRLKTQTGAERIAVRTPTGIIEALRITVSELYIGPIHLRNVEAAVCEECPFLAGQSVLSRFTMQTLREDDTNFLILRAR